MDPLVGLERPERRVFLVILDATVDRETKDSRDVMD